MNTNLECKGLSRVKNTDAVEVCSGRNSLDFLTKSVEFNAHLVPDEYFLNCGVRREQDGESVFLSRRVDAAILRVSSSDQTSALVGPADLQGELMVTGLGQADDK